MARPGRVALALALTAVLWMVMATAQPPSSCMDVIISMAPCLDYIMGNSTIPTTGCCTQLASVVHSDPKCLCQVINGGGDVAELGITVNRTVALQLPSACNVHTPSVSRCDDVTSSPSESPSTPRTPSGTSPSSTTKPVPTSEGHITKAGSAVFFALFLFAGTAWNLGCAAAI